MIKYCEFGEIISFTSLRLAPRVTNSSTILKKGEENPLPFKLKKVATRHYNIEALAVPDIEAGDLYYFSSCQIKSTILLLYGKWSSKMADAICFLVVFLSY